jgi:hypothetical protein
VIGVDEIGFADASYGEKSVQEAGVSRTGVGMVHMHLLAPDGSEDVPLGPSAPSLFADAQEAPKPDPGQFCKP